MTKSIPQTRAQLPASGASYKLQAALETFAGYRVRGRRQSAWYFKWHPRGDTPIAFPFGSVPFDRASRRGEGRGGAKGSKGRKGEEEEEEKRSTDSSRATQVFLHREGTGSSPPLEEASCTRPRRAPELSCRGRQKPSPGHVIATRGSWHAPTTCTNSSGGLVSTCAQRSPKSRSTPTIAKVR